MRSKFPILAFGSGKHTQGTFPNGCHHHSLSPRVAGLGRSGGQPAHSKSILNSFSVVDWLTQAITPSIDPRSTLLVPPDVLDTPPLIDGSEPPYEAQGAAADVSTASSQIGPGETVSESQLAVTVEGLNRVPDFFCPRSAVVYSQSSVFADASFHTESLEPDSMQNSPSYLGTSRSTSYSSPTTSPDIHSPQIVLPESHAAQPPQTSPNLQPSSRFLTCPMCPRPFKTKHELE